MHADHGALYPTLPNRGRRSPVGKTDRQEADNKNRNADSEDRSILQYLLLTFPGYEEKAARLSTVVWRRTGHASQTQWFIHLRAHGLRKGDEHPAYTHPSRGMWYPLPFFVHSWAAEIREL